MTEDATPLEYAIKFEKDHANVRATYEVIAPLDEPALIADFQLTVSGTDLISTFLPGQSRFNGVRFHTLAKPEEDVTVSFSISSNQGWTAGDEDTLRGEKAYDDAHFTNKND